MQNIPNTKAVNVSLGVLFGGLMLIFIFLSNILHKEDGGFIDNSLPMIAVYCWVIITVASFFTTRKLFGLGSLVAALLFAGVAIYGLSKALY